MKTNSLMLRLLSVASCVSAQSKKQIREYGISSVTETITLFENGIEKETFKSQFMSWDKKGNVTEDAAWNREGSIRYREARVFDGDEEMEEILEYPAGKKGSDKPLFRKTVSKYSGGNKTEEKVFDKDGKLEETTIFTYNGMGDKTAETATDGAGQKTGYNTYEYDKKGLRALKTEFKADGTVKRKTAYVYTF